MRPRGLCSSLGRIKPHPRHTTARYGSLYKEQQNGAPRVLLDVDRCRLLSISARCCVDHHIPFNLDYVLFTRDNFHHQIPAMVLCSCSAHPISFVPGHPKTFQAVSDPIQLVDFFTVSLSFPRPRPFQHSDRFVSVPFFLFPHIPSCSRLILDLILPGSLSFCLVFSLFISFHFLLPDSTLIPPGSLPFSPHSVSFPPDSTLIPPGSLSFSSRSGSPLAARCESSGYCAQRRRRGRINPCWQS